MQRERTRFQMWCANPHPLCIKSTISVWFVLLFSNSGPVKIGFHLVSTITLAPTMALETISTWRCLISSSPNLKLLWWFQFKCHYIMIYIYWHWRYSQNTDNLWLSSHPIHSHVELNQLQRPLASRSFYLLNSMIIWSKWSVDIYECRIPVLRCHIHLVDLVSL